MTEDITNGKYKLTTENRLTRLETMVEEIRDNHLAHLDKKMDRLYWLILTTLVGVIVSIIMKAM